MGGRHTCAEALELLPKRLITLGSQHMPCTRLSLLYRAQFLTISLLSWFVGVRVSCCLYIACALKLLWGDAGYSSQLLHGDVRARLRQRHDRNDNDAAYQAWGNAPPRTGESGLRKGMQRSASVEAVTEVNLAVFSTEDLERIITYHSQYGIDPNAGGEQQREGAVADQRGW